MTKKELAVITEALVEKIATKHGATVYDHNIKVAGKPQVSRIAVGGAFDLDAARRILGHAIQQLESTLLEFNPFQVANKSVDNGASGPRIGPDGKVIMGLPARNQVTTNGATKAKEPAKA